LRWRTDREGYKGYVIIYCRNGGEDDKDEEGKGSTNGKENRRRRKKRTPTVALNGEDYRKKRGISLLKRTGLSFKTEPNLICGLPPKSIVGG
jgi:hypothetical protein